MSESKRLIRHLRDPDFTIVAHVESHHVSYTVYEIVGFAEGQSPGIYDAPRWHEAGSDASHDTVDSLEQSEPYLHGDVKWDGCSNWAFDEQDRCMLHGCSREDLARFSAMMTACWDWTAELLPGWQGQ